MSTNILARLHLVGRSSTCANLCGLLPGGNGRTVPCFLLKNTPATIQAPASFSSGLLLHKLRGVRCEDGLSLHQRSKKISAEVPPRTLNSRCLSSCSASTSVPAKAVLTNQGCGRTLVSRTTRMRHSQSGNGEIPVVFVNKAATVGIKDQKKQSPEQKATIIARSRTKKPTRLGIQDKKESQDSWLCTAFSTAEEYHLEHLSLDLQSRGSFLPIAMPQDAQDVLLMTVTSSETEHKNEPSEIFFFREGSVVFWNVPDTKLRKVLRIISKHEFRPYEVAMVTWENEHLNFCYGSQGTKLTDDAIILDQNANTDTTTLEKFAFSNAMALSVKLGIWESSVDKFTSSLESIPESLKRGHRLKMSRVEVMRKTGELFSLRHQINLSSDLLISPDFYWDRDDLDELYNKTCQFYSIGRRTRVTNEKLNHCSELVELMRTHLSERHSLKLEWMIILLIGVEVMFEVIHYIKKYYEDSDQVIPAEAASNNNTASTGRR